MDTRTRTEQEELLLALEEKARRELRRKPPFLPNEGQLPVLSSKKLIRLVTSGNGSGKTVLAVNEGVLTMQGFNPYTNQKLIVPNKVIYVLDKPNKVADKIWPEMKKFYDTSTWETHKDGTPGIRRISMPNGSEMLFMFHDQDPMSFESIDGYGIVIYDEPPPRHIFIALSRGGRSKGFKTRHLFAGTPIGSNSAWLRTELLEAWKNGDQDIDVFNFHTSVNAINLDDGYIETFSKRLSEKEKLIRLSGQWSDLDGLALAHLFNPKVHVLPSAAQWDKGNPCVVSIDPHPSKAHVAMLLGVDRDDRLYVLKELSIKMLPREFARELRRWYATYNVIDIVCDNLGSAELTGAEGFLSFIEVLKQEGVRVRATRYDEKVDAEWIQRMQDALLIPDKPDQYGQMLPKLRIMPDCRGTVSDIKNVQWLKVRNIDEYKPTLDISNKDYLACLKYALAQGLSYNKPRKMKPIYHSGSMYGVTRPAKERLRVKMDARATYARKFRG